jgi:hypothetical protein
MKINGSGESEKTNPIQTQSKPIQSQLKPIKCQNKPNTNPIKPNFSLTQTPQIPSLNPSSPRRHSEIMPDSQGSGLR